MLNDRFAVYAWEVNFLGGPEIASQSMVKGVDMSGQSSTQQIKEKAGTLLIWGCSCLLLPPAGFNVLGSPFQESYQGLFSDPPHMSPQEAVP